MYLILRYTNILLGLELIIQSGSISALAVFFLLYYWMNDSLKAKVTPAASLTLVNSLYHKILDIGVVFINSIIESFDLSLFKNRPETISKTANPIKIDIIISFSFLLTNSITLPALSRVAAKAQPCFHLDQ